MKTLKLWIKYLEKNKEFCSVYLSHKKEGSTCYHIHSLPRDKALVLKLEKSGYQVSLNSLREKFPFANLAVEDEPQPTNIINTEEDSE